MTTIIVTYENNETDEFEFDQAMRTITLGRRSTNDVCISDLSVSGNHATLSLNDEETIFEDLNSTNGSYVNGQVTKSTAVKAGDEIILGKIVIIVKSEAMRPADKAVVANSANDDSADDSYVGDDESAGRNNLAKDIEISAGNNAMDQAEIDSLQSLRSIPDSGRAPEPIRASGIPAAAVQSTAMAQASAQPVEAQAAPDQAAHPLEGIEHMVVPAPKAEATPLHELDSPSGTSKGAVIEIKNGAKSGQILPIDKPVTTLGRPGIQIAAIMRKPDGYFLMHIESDDTIDRPTLNKDSVGDEPILLHSGDELTVAGIDVEFMLS